MNDRKSKVIAANVPEDLAALPGCANPDANAVSG